MNTFKVRIMDRFGRERVYNFTKREYNQALPSLLEEMLYSKCTYTVEIDGEVKEFDYYNLYK